MIVVGTLCNTDCTVPFTKSSFTILDPQVEAILTGWLEATSPKLRHFYLHPQCPPTDPPVATMALLQAFSAYDLPSVEPLFYYLQAPADFPVRSTWISTIKTGNYLLWPGITYANAFNFFRF